MNTPAVLWQTSDRGRVTCQLCAHRCTLSPGARGPCFLRRNQGGSLVTDAYSELRVAVPSVVERKPLFHFLPGAITWTLGTAGCNLRCSYCQNAALSQPGDPRAPSPPPRRPQDPETVVADARAAGAFAVAFSFSEPSVAYEWVRDVMVAAREAGLRVIWVTNGFFTPELLDRLATDGAPDAANVDLKAADDVTWRQVMGARLDPILESLSGLRQLGTWVEVSTVLIPGINDDAAARSRMANWILERLGEEAPWHLWRFHPDFCLTDRGPLSSQALKQAGDDARAEGLQHVYLGPAGGVADQTTYCFSCSAPLVERVAYEVCQNRVRAGHCPDCGHRVSGIWPLATSTPSIQPSSSKRVDFRMSKRKGDAPRAGRPLGLRVPGVGP